MIGVVSGEGVRVQNCTVLGFRNLKYAIGAGVYILVIGVILGPWPKSQLKNKNIQGGGVILGPGKVYFLGPFAKKGYFLGPKETRSVFLGPKEPK